MQRTVSIAFQTDHPITAYGALGATAEGYGFDGVSVYNDMLYQPAWLPLLEIARNTRRVRLGPAAVNPFTCHPINIAGNIALIDEMSQGRAYLGLARGAWLDFVGMEPKRPITALREAMECVQHLLSRSTQPYHGEIFRLRAAMRCAGTSCVTMCRCCSARGASAPCGMRAVYHRSKDWRHSESVGGATDWREHCQRCPPWRAQS